MIGCHFLVRIFYKFASGILSADKQLTSLLNDAFCGCCHFSTDLPQPWSQKRRSGYKSC